MNLHSNKDDGFGACNTEVYTARLDFNKDSHISPIDAISSINALNMGGKDAICNAHYQNNILWSCNLATCVGTNGDGVNLGSLIINYRNNPEYEDIRCQSGYNFRFDVDKDQEINNDDEDIIAGIVNWDVDGSGNPISNARKNYECNQLYQNPLNRCEGDAADFVDCFQLAEFIDDFLSIHGSGIECDNTVYEARLDVNKDGFIVPIDALIPRNTFNLGGNEANSNAICNAYYQNNEYECRL
jgi:hypothetical protein